MRDEKTLPNLREAILLSVLLHGQRYGRELGQEYEKRTGQSLPAGSLYVTLNRMERMGFVRSWMGDQTHELGGNRRKYFQLTAQGHRSLDAVDFALRGTVPGVAGRGETQ